jgi:colanic acid biosynthesis glycosyl transferase WcaI
MAQHYAPEEVSGAVLGTELAADLVKRGYQVTFLTCAPNYPLGKTFPGYKNNIFSDEMIDNVRVVRVWSYISTKSFWRRIINYGTFSFSAFWGGILSGRHDLLLSFSPPLPLGVSAWLVSKILRIPWILNVMDIYPEIAVATGILKNPLAIEVFEGMEKFLYQRATQIQVLSEGFKDNLLHKGVPSEKISIIPVWADPSLIHPMKKENNFSQEHGVDKKFVVMYSGNLGVNSSLEDAIMAADILKTEEDIYFLFVGEGVRKDSLILMAEQKGLKFVSFLPYQPRELLNSMLASADVGLVTLHADAHHTSLPSKTFNIMASGRPILAVTPIESEISRLIQRYQCGVVVQPRSPEKLAESILLLKNNPELCLELGKNGRMNLEASFSRDYCVSLYDHDFQTLSNLE